MTNLCVAPFSSLLNTRLRYSRYHKESNEIRFSRSLIVSPLSFTMCARPLSKLVTLTEITIERPTSESGSLNPHDFTRSSFTSTCRVVSLLNGFPARIREKSLVRSTASGRVCALVVTVESPSFAVTLIASYE